MEAGICHSLYWMLELVTTFSTHLCFTGVNCDVITCKSYATLISNEGEIVISWEFIVSYELTTLHF